jgi:thioredoxin reductase
MLDVVVVGAPTHRRARRLLGPRRLQLPERVVFADGAPLERQAIFTHPPTRQRSDLPRQLGCTILDDDSIQVDDRGDTGVRGVYAAGDMARRPTMPVPGAMVIIAAAEGAVSGVAIDQDLFFESLT